jgi:hypothetical protein
VPLDKPLTIYNREGLAEVLGSCNNCKRSGARDPRVQEFTVGTLTFKLCSGCRELLKEVLSRPLKPLPAPDRDSPEWSQRAYSLALEHAPNIYPCKRCGWPVVDNVVCHCGGQADRNSEPFSE